MLCELIPSKAMPYMLDDTVLFSIVLKFEVSNKFMATTFESMVFSVLLLVVIYQVVRWRRPAATVALAPAAGFALFLMGWSLTVPHAATPLAAALDNFWLFIHASFATAGAATCEDHSKPRIPQCSLPISQCEF